MPAPIVDADLMPPVDQVAGLDGAIAVVDVSSEALHFREQLIVLISTDLKVSKIAGNGRDSGGR